jgi:hypothetical protein
MLRSLALTSFLVLGASASAQQPVPSSRAQPILGAIRDAGVYHLATGTWTRHASQAQLGADTIYDNTCTGTTFGPLGGDHFVDEGRIPSPSGPTNVNNRPGCSMQYTIDGFQIGYCTDQMSMGTYTLNFFERYAACTSVVGVAPTGSFALTGLPASAGTSTCWTLTIDLDSPPQSASLAFDMRVDGPPPPGAGASPNLFGLEIFSSLPAASATQTGPIIAGNAAVCLGFDGTRWDTVVNYAEAGTGMSTLNQFYVEQGPTAPGCYYYPNAPMSSFHLELYSDACTSPVYSLPYCAGDGSGAACPCTNHSPAGHAEGCLNSLGIGGKLRASGVPRIAADTVTLIGTQMPPDSFALYFQGSGYPGGGGGTAFGDGKLCSANPMVRLKTVHNAGGSSQYPQAGDPPIHVRAQFTTAGTRNYQVWYRNAATYCTMATFNASNGLAIAWGV